MSRALVAVSSLLLWSATLPSKAAELPSGSRLSVRLTSGVSSQRSRPGTPVDGVLIAPVRQAGRSLLPSGSRVLGRVMEARGGLGRRATLMIRFDQLVEPDGTPVAIQARVTDVDNARERVRSDGTIVGLPAFLSPPSKAHGLLLLAAYAHPVVLAVVEAGRLAKRMAERVSIDYGPGVELSLALERGATIPDREAEEPGRGLLPPGLAGIAEAVPLRTVAPKAGQASDMTNVLIVGSRADLESAFEAAGWARAEPMRPHAAVKGFLALAGDREYARAPVSLLELRGRPPTAVFEKQCNTLAKRHHVRFWEGLGESAGSPLWLGAASHDIGIGYSRAEGAFTHRVDRRIDLERDKIVDDLLFSGWVEATILVDRPLAPRAFVTAAGEQVETDGRIAVLVLAPPGSGRARDGGREGGPGSWTW